MYTNLYVNFRNLLFIVYHLMCVYEYFHSYFYKDTRKRKLEILNKYIDKVIYINLEKEKIEEKVLNSFYLESLTRIK